MHDVTRGADAVPLYREHRAALARVALRRAAEKRQEQARKKETAVAYRVGDYVWRKTSRRSDALHKKTRKLVPLV